LRTAIFASLGSYTWQNFIQNTNFMKKICIWVTTYLLWLKIRTKKRRTKRITDYCDFWPKLRFLTKMAIVDQNCDFWPKFRFLTKIRSSPKLRCLTKIVIFAQIEIFGQNSDFWRKFEVLTKIPIFDQNLDFWPKFTFYPTFRCLSNISTVDRNFDFFTKNSHRLFSHHLVRPRR